MDALSSRQDRLDAPSAPPPLPSRAAPRSDLASHAAAGDDLLAEVGASLTTLRQLLGHAPVLGTPGATIQSTLQDVDRRLARNLISVVVIGEKGAGKSTFLNALLGARLFGAANVVERGTVTFVHRADALEYRARLVDDTVEVFSEVCPDRSDEITARAKHAEQEIATLNDQRARVAKRASDMEEAVTRDEAMLAAGFTAFEVRRDDAAQVGAELGPAEQDALRCDEALRAAENRVPAALRPRPAVWAVWLWFARAIFALVRWSVWRAYRAALRDQVRAQARVVDLRKLGTRAAEACREAEAMMAPTAAQVEQGRRALVALRREIGDLDNKIEKQTKAGKALARELTKHQADRRDRFFTDVRALSDMRERGRQVVELEIGYPARLLPDDIVIIDTPGVTDDTHPGHERAWSVIREEADGCILVSELKRAVSDSTKRFLQRVRAVVPHVLLVLTKMDQVFVDALHRGQDAPWEEVDQARRIGTRRFAREIGREPTNVLSVAVAAEAALKGERSGGFARQFEQNAAKLFQLLRQERALILGTRAAAAIRRCIGVASEAEERAERGYRARIALLEAHRVPDPGDFCAEQLVAIEPSIAEAAAKAVHSALEMFGQGSMLLRARCAERINAARSRAELEALLPSLEAALGEGIVKGLHEVHAHLEMQVDRAVREIEKHVFDALRRRYEIAHTVTRDARSHPQLEGLAPALDPVPVPLTPKAQGAVKSLVPFRVGLGVGGAAAGAALGTVVLPGIGTAVGAAVGALLNFARTLGSVKRACIASVDATLLEQERVIADRIRAMQPALSTSIHGSVERALAHVVERFGRWIAEPIEAERAAIEAEHAKLRDVQALREKLQTHDGRLESLIRGAADSSVGLCR